jgi:hypothetical protein
MKAHLPAAVFSILLSLHALCAAASEALTPLDVWTRVHPKEWVAPRGPVAYGNGLYAAPVHGFGKPEILVSTNAVDWVPSDADFEFIYSDIIFAEDRFWAVGGHDEGSPAAIFSSSDGLDWEFVYSSNYEGVARIRYENGRWLAVEGDENVPNRLLSSVNGRDWVRLPEVVHPGFWWFEVVNGLWLAMGHAGTDYFSSRSTNTVDWTPIESAGTQLPREGLHGMSAGGGLFLVHGSVRVDLAGGGARYRPYIAWSSDGLSWSNAVLPELPSSHVASIAYGSSGFVALARSFATSEALILTSTDGREWQSQPMPLRTALGSVSFAGGLYFAAGEQGVLLTSPNGIDWTKRLGASSRNIHSMTGGPAGALAVGEGGLILSSTTGLQWRRHEQITQERLVSVIYHQGLYVAVGGETNALVLVSTNLNQWELWEDKSLNPLRAAAGLGDEIMAVGLGGTVVRSGAAGWSGLTVAGAPDFRSIAGFRDRWIALAHGPVTYGDWLHPGMLYTSTDGENWSTDVTHTNALFQVAVSDDLAVVLGFGVRLTSTNGAEWEISPGPQSVPAKLIFADGLFLTVYSGGANTVYSSENGKNWARHEDVPILWYEFPSFAAMRWVGYANDHVYIGFGAEHIWRSASLTPNLLAPVLDGDALVAPVLGWSNRVARLQASADLRTWNDFGLITNSPAGIRSLRVSTTEPARFYRLVPP